VNWKHAGLTILILAVLALAPFIQKIAGDTRPPDNTHYTLTPVTLKMAQPDKSVFEVSTTLRLDTQSGKTSIMWYKPAAANAPGGWFWADIGEK